MRSESSLYWRRSCTAGMESSSVSQFSKRKRIFKWSCYYWDDGPDDDVFNSHIFSWVFKWVNDDGRLFIHLQTSLIFRKVMVVASFRGII